MKATVICIHGDNLNLAACHNDVANKDQVCVMMFVCQQK